MGSLHKNKDSPYWQGSFRLGDKWKLRSTGQTDKKQAQKVLDGWEQAAVTMLSSPQQARLVLQEILAASLGDDRGNITCRKYVERWLAQQKGTIAVSSYKFYESTLTCWLRELGAAADKDIDALSQDQLIAWRNVEAKRVAIRTVNHRLKAVRRVLAAATKEGYMRTNPAKELGTLKAPVGKRKAKKVRRPFTMEELYRIDALMNDEWQSILWMGFFTGQRLGDILTFEWSDISFPKESLHLIAGKTGKKIWLPAPPELMQRLAKWRKQDDTRSPYVFPAWAAKVADAEGRVAKASNRFAHYLWKAGLRTHSPFGRDRERERTAKETPKENNRRAQQELSFHCLRHTARTAMEEAGVPKAVIDAYIGHDGDTGEDYTTVGHDALRNAAGVLSARAAGGLVPRIAPGAFSAVAAEEGATTSAGTT